MKKNDKIIIGIVVLIILSIGIGLTISLSNKKEEEEKIEEKREEKEEKIIQVFDMDSKDRPLAVVINNTPVAVKVQEGLQDAYLIYEFPTEGNTSRLLALFQNQANLEVGTIRSVRHNFIDYANENDAILVGYGWSKYARAELEKGDTDYVNGMVHSTVFHRNNPENLAWEHTAYTTLDKVKNFARSKYRMESEVKPPLNYSVEEITLDNYESQSAKNIILNYGPSNQENYKYNEESKMYERYFNQTPSLDYKTKETLQVKNIIITTLTASPVVLNSKYLDLHNTGSKEGYYITNGKAIKITCSKETRNGRTKYLDEQGKEIVLNDGKTLIALFLKGKEMKIE